MTLPEPMGYLCLSVSRPAYTTPPNNSLKITAKLYKERILFRFRRGVIFFKSSIRFNHLTIAIKGNCVSVDNDGKIKMFEQCIPQ